MKIVRNYLTTLLVLLTFNIHNAQNIEIENLKYLEFKGTVINSENKEPLIFANINLIDSNISTISNSDGNFSLKITDSYKSKKIKISFIGFKTKIIDLNSYEKLDKPISLDVFVSPLSETIIAIPKNVKQLVEETLTNYGDNYLENHNVMTAFYR